MPAIAASPFFIIGHDSPFSIFMTVAEASPFFIGHESPLQQSQLSQHEAVSVAEVVLDASLFFRGQESPLQQQHDIAVVVEVFVAV